MCAVILLSSVSVAVPCSACYQQKQFDFLIKVKDCCDQQQQKQKQKQQDRSDNLRPPPIVSNHPPPPRDLYLCAALTYPISDLTGA